MKKLEDPDDKKLKELLRYGESNGAFLIRQPKSRLYRMIIKKPKLKWSKSNLLCIVDDKSIRINTLYKNDAHKEEISKWADRLGKLGVEYKASELDLSAMKGSSSATPNWRLNKKPTPIPNSISQLVDLAQTSEGVTFTQRIIDMSLMDIF